MTDIVWYGYLILLFLPLLISTAVSLYIQLYLKRINRQEKNPPWTYKKSLINAIIFSSPLAALTQILLQEALFTKYVYLSETAQTNLIIFCALFSPFLVILTYSGLLWHTKGKYPLLYEWLRIRHTSTNDEEYWDDESSEYTIKGYHKNSGLNGNDKSEE
jgi:hypothetical protein